ncbi:iron ABC transporter permease [bacterium]|nr:iron ABC transporter permease [bacterium]
MILLNEHRMELMTDAEEEHEAPCVAEGFLHKRKLVWSLWLLGLGVLMAVAFVVGCAVGPAAISPLTILKIVLSKLGFHSLEGGWSATQEMIILGIRVPRVVMGLIVGASLGVVGAAFQCILRNPLADPFVLGVSSGAALGASVAIAFGLAIPMLHSAGTPLIAFMGAMLATFIIYRISMVRGNINAHTLILCGVILNSFLASVMMMIYAAAKPDRIYSLLLWLMGDLESAGDWLLVPMLIMLAGMVWVYLLSPSMNAMTLGDEAASALGVNVKRAKQTIFLVCALIVGSAVSATGMIGFVGLVAPHISRALVTADHRFVVPSSALLGAALVVLADAFGRWILSPAELPVGAVTSLLGAPFFIYILRKRARNVWSD